MAIPHADRTVAHAFLVVIAVPKMLAPSVAVARCASICRRSGRGACGHDQHGNNPIRPGVAAPSHLATNSLSGANGSIRPGRRIPDGRTHVRVEVQSWCRFRMRLPHSALRVQEPETRLVVHLPGHRTSFLVRTRGAMPQLRYRTRVTARESRPSWGRTMHGRRNLALTTRLDIEGCRRPQGRGSCGGWAMRLVSIACHTDPLAERATCASRNHDAAIALAAVTTRSPCCLESHGISGRAGG